METYKVTVEPTSVINKGGRPKKHDQPPTRVIAYVTEEEHRFLKKYGGEYDGISGYIQHLIQKEMKRAKE